MKIVYVFLLISIQAGAQSKRDNAIKIPAADMSVIKTALFNSGFIIEGTDTTAFLTNSIEVDNFSVRLAFLKSDSITIKCFSKLNVGLNFGGATVNDDFSLVEYRGAKGSANMKAWGIMKKVAKEISQNVSYRRL